MCTYSLSPTHSITLSQLDPPHHTLTTHTSTHSLHHTLTTNPYTHSYPLHPHNLPLHPLSFQSGLDKVQVLVEPLPESEGASSHLILQAITDTSTVHEQALSEICPTLQTCCLVTTFWERSSSGGTARSLWPR